MLVCRYSELSQVHSVAWKYQNKSDQLPMSSSRPGIITTTVSLPITPDTAGNYSCILTLKNGQSIRAVLPVALPSEGGKYGMLSQKCFLLSFIDPILCYQHRSPDRLPVNFAEIMIHECGWFSDMCSVRHSPVHSSQPEVNSPAREPMIYRGESSWQIPYVMLI